jgi:hypothetical protein
VRRVQRAEPALLGEDGDTSGDGRQEDWRRVCVSHARVHTCTARRFPEPLEALIGRAHQGHRPPQVGGTRSSSSWGVADSGRTMTVLLS